MSTNGDNGMLREITREVLAELLPGLLEQAMAAPAAAPRAADQAIVPAPPVAAVHRPPGWVSPNVRVEQVELRDDGQLEAFVRSLLRRLDDPRERAALESGALRFTLASASDRVGDRPQLGQPAVIRVERGAVTERMVRDAASAGARLLLSRRAVLTPMARDRARSLGVAIEKERAC